MNIKFCNLPSGFKRSFCHFAWYVSFKVKTILDPYIKYIKDYILEGRLGG